MGRKRDSSCIESPSNKNDSFKKGSVSEKKFTSNLNDKIQKKKLRENESDSEEDDFDIKGEFDFNDPNEDDYHGIKNILLRTQYKQIKNLNIQEFVDTICNQGNIGTTISISNSVIAISTIINFRQYKPVMYSIAEFIIKTLVKYNQEKFEKFFNSIIFVKNVGLLVNERLSNLPQELIPVLSNSLSEDVKWTIKNMNTLVPVEEREFYNWDYIILFSIRYSTEDNQSFFFKKYEEEEVINNSLYKLIWPTNKKELCGSDNNDKELMNEEYVMAIIEYEKFQKYYFQLKN